MNIQGKEPNNLMEIFLVRNSNTVSYLITYIFHPLGIYLVCEVT